MIYGSCSDKPREPPRASTSREPALRSKNPAIYAVLPTYNDPVRGDGVFDRVMKNIAAIPDDFGPTVMVQCVLHRGNQHRLEELITELRPTRVQGLTFSFYVPRAGEVSERAWETNQEREEAVEIVFELKRRHPDFIWNSTRSLELLRPPACKQVTDNCPMQRTMLPLYIEGDPFTTPFCCYGNDVDCDRCGSLGRLLDGGPTRSSRRIGWELRTSKP